MKKKRILKRKLDPLHLCYDIMCHDLGSDIFDETFGLKNCKIVVEVYEVQE